MRSSLPARTAPPCYVGETMKAARLPISPSLMISCASTELFMRRVCVQVGDGTFVNQRDLPVSVLAGNVSAVSAGGAVGGYFKGTCAVVSGTVYCWGDGYAYSYNNFPQAVGGLPAYITSVSVGYDLICVLSAAGDIYCWGSNQNGQLGFGSCCWSPSSPVMVTGLTSPVAIVSCGFYFACALLTTGSVVCWGRNDVGQLGDGTWNDQSSPVQVRGLSSGVASISCGPFHTCVVTTTGAALCWGSNSEGQLGTSLLTYLCRVCILRA